MTEKSIKGRETYLMSINNFSVRAELLKEMEGEEGFCPERQMESRTVLSR